MTEQEWNACTDPQAMLEFLRGKASDRHLRLFAVACCRRIWHLLADTLGCRAVEIAEQCAEGLLTVHESFVMGRELDLAWNNVLINSAMQKTGCSREACDSALFAANLVTGWLDPAQAGNVATAVVWANIWQTVPDVDNLDEDAIALLPSQSPERRVQAAILREVVGPLPFRPVTMNPPWRTPTVTNLAESIYQERAFDRLPILADALEDAGCSNADILNHCRQGGEHVRGCWVVDLLLGKE